MVIIEMKQFQEVERSVRWLRGMSPKQVNACNNLLYALRDDIEQESTYRVRECLLLLGLHPMMNARQIKIIIGISQGNDLAFLWFMWETYYKQTHGCEEERNHYTSNEQLILTAIAHLDMETTMRGLDKILPTSEHSKKHLDALRAREQKLAKEQQIKSQLKLKSQLTRKSNAHRSPYFEKQVRPKRYVPMSPIATPKDRKVLFPNYSNYTDEMHSIPNEASRWFSTYTFSPNLRNVKKLISDALSQLFVTDRTAGDKQLCNVHRMVEQSTARKQEQLTLEALQRCMQMLDVPGSQRRERSERIVRQLEREVECAAQQLRLYRSRQLTTLQKIKGDGKSCSGCQMCEQLVSTPGFETERKADFSFLLSPDFNIPGHPATDLKEQEDEAISVLQWGSDKQHKKILLAGRQKDTLRWPSGTGARAYCSSNAKKPRSCKTPCANEGLIKVLNGEGDIARIIEPSRISTCLKPCSSSEDEELKFCSRRTMENGILQWDFFKIFDTPLDEAKNDEQPLIRSYCIQALKKAMEGQVESKQLSNQTAADAADKCAVSMFRDAHENRRKSLHQQEAINTDRLEVTNIDPEDTPTLIELLKTAIDILKTNPHYVLVTLPNAHKLPVLLDWIANRYGKTYSYLQMIKMAKSSRIVYDQLTLLSDHKKFLMPDVKRFVKKNDISVKFGQHVNLLSRLRQMRGEYYRRLNNRALEESRLIWLALRGYTQLPGSNLETFFAYMPAKDQDFIRYHIWKSTDYRKADCLRKDNKRRWN